MWTPASAGRGLFGTITGTGPVVGERLTYSSGSPSGCEFGDHVDSDQPGPFERLQQTISAVQQLFDLLAGQLASTCQLAEHSLAIRPGLVDHLATLLLGHRQLGLGVGSGIRAPPRRLDLGFLAHAGRLVARLGEELRCALLGLLTDLCGALAGGGEHACGLLAQQPGERLLVELHRREIGIRLGGAQLALEEPLALLQPAELGSDHAEELADLALVETAAAGSEGGVGNRRR